MLFRSRNLKQVFNFLIKRGCSTTILNNLTYTNPSVLPIYKRLIKAGWYEWQTHVKQKIIGKVIFYTTYKIAKDNGGLNNCKRYIISFCNTNIATFLGNTYKPPPNKKESKPFQYFQHISCLRH